MEQFLTSGQECAQNGHFWPIWALLLWYFVRDFLKLRKVELFLATILWCISSWKAIAFQSLKSKDKAMDGPSIALIEGDYPSMIAIDGQSPSGKWINSLEAINPPFKKVFACLTSKHLVKQGETLVWQAKSLSNKRKAMIIFWVQRLAPKSLGGRCKSLGLHPIYEISLPARNACLACMLHMHVSHALIGGSLLTACNACESHATNCMRSMQFKEYNSFAKN